MTKKHHLWILPDTEILLGCGGEGWGFDNFPPDNYSLARVLEYTKEMHCWLSNLLVFETKVYSLKLKLDIHICMLFSQITVFKLVRIQRLGGVRSNGVRKEYK